MWKPKYIDTDITLYIAIADAIERDIKENILVPGEKMPTQRAIAEIIGVNLTTITRAYNLARKRNLLTAVIGKGTFVADQSRELLPESFSKDEVIDLGLVGSVKIDEKKIKKIMENIISDNKIDMLLDYVPSRGLLSHREAGAKWVQQHGVDAKASDIIICSGAMHAINCTLRGLLDTEDRIAVDSQTFTGFINASRLNHMRLEAIEMDGEGMKPEALEVMCQKHKMKGLYLMPNLQNPTSTRMSHERKKAIAEIIKKYDLLLIEDDIYNLFDDEHRKPLAYYVPEHTIYICGISKTLYPGLRIAYAKVPEKHQQKFIQTVTSTVWMAPPISAEIATQLINSGLAFEIVEKKRKIINKRLSIVRNILEDYEIIAAENSQFAWLRLPKAFSAITFENTALLNSVKVISAEKFNVGQTLIPNAVRLSVANVTTDEELIKGLKIIVKILENPSMTMSSIM